MKTFQVPVWFNVQSETQDDAWEFIIQEMVRLVGTNSAEWVVEEPVEIREED